MRRWDCGKQFVQWKTIQLCSTAILNLFNSCSTWMSIRPKYVRLVVLSAYWFHSTMPCFKPTSTRINKSKNPCRSMNFREMETSHVHCEWFHNHVCHPVDVGDYSWYVIGGDVPSSLFVWICLHAAVSGTRIHIRSKEKHQPKDQLTLVHYMSGFAWTQHFQALKNPHQLITLKVLS